METGDAVPKQWSEKVGEVLIGSAAIARRVAELGEQLSTEYQGQYPVLLVVLKGSFIFSADLSRALTIEHEIQFIRARSYEGTESSGSVSVTGIEGVDLKGRHVLVVEDIVDTGLTLMSLMEHFSKMGAASVKSCTLLQKETARRRADTPAVSFTAFTIPDKFVVGYGLDFDQRLRHLPFVGVYKT